MILSRTPYRVSFFGGGTDYHSWYQRHGGSVLSTTIDKYCYVTARYLPPFHTEKSRVIWSIIETVQNNEDIQHPAVRNCLRYLGINNGIEIHHTGDLPARSGLGSSSAFTVGLLNALRTLQGCKSNKRDLAIEAVHIERDIMKENVGIQDQIACAHGGFNRVDIDTEGRFNVLPLKMHPAEMGSLQKHLMLFFTGVTRTASNIAAEQIKTHIAGNKDKELIEMQSMVSTAWTLLNRHKDNFEDFGRLLHESWLIKRSIASNISSVEIDCIYNTARDAGAMGGKLLGAGGGGFMLIMAHPERHACIRNALKELLHVPFAFEHEGSSIINTVS